MQKQSIGQLEPIHIEGTTLEGGGQLVRISLCLSALTGRAIRITSIRGNRARGGGLKGQHLTAAQWLANACAGGATVEGLKLGSQTLVFAPGSSLSTVEARPWWHQSVINMPSGEQVAARATTVDLKTPGAITLVLQALLPFLMFNPAAPTNEEEEVGVSAPEPILLTVKGGTNVSMAPSIDYVHQVLFPNLRLLFPNIPGIEALQGPSRLRRGWSTGKTVLGEAGFLITPLARGTQLTCNRELLRTPLHQTKTISLKAIVLAPFTTPLPALVQKAVHQTLRKSFRLVDRSNVEVQTEDSRDPKRLYLLLVAETSSGLRVASDWLFDAWAKGERDAFEKAATRLVERVAEDLLADLNSKTRSLDRHMTDQIAVFQALARGSPTTEARGENVDTDDADKTKDEDNLHAATARWISSLMLGVQPSAHGNSASTNREAGFISGVVGGGL